MPSKGKRVASRQNNLRRRRGNANRNSQPAPAAPAAVAESPVASAGASSATTTATASAATATATTAPVATQATGRPESQARGRRFDRPAAYNHAGPELVRIGIFSGVLLAALIVVSFII